MYSSKEKSETKTSPRVSSRNTRRRQVLPCFSLIKGARKKSVVGAWVCILVGIGGEITATAPRHPKFHAPAYHGYARNTVIHTPCVVQRDISIYRCSLLWGAGPGALCSHKQGSS